MITFLKRGDNSHQLPGKRDSIEVKENTTLESQKRRIQKYILSDCLSNLYLKFQAEYPDEKISFSIFCRIRPSYMKLVSFSTRKTCLCQYHQNLSLKLKAIKAMKIQKVSINLDSFIRVFQSDTEIIDLLETIPSDENVDYQEWKRVEVTEGGKAKSRAPLVNRKVNKNEFVKIMKADVSFFREHADRIKKQYRNLKVLKDTLPANNAIMQMDFAENYRCQCKKEVQSAYFDGPQVTLHSEAGEVKPLSYIIVSDELSHSASTVYTFVRKMIPIVKEKVQNLTFLHYWTDSPTSQHRN